MDIVNPLTFKFAPSPDPLTESYVTRLRDHSTGEIYATESFAKDSHPIVGGYYTRSFDGLRTQLLNAGKENVPVGVTAQAVGPSGVTSIEIAEGDGDVLLFIHIEPPANLDVV